DTAHFDAVAHPGRGGGDCQFFLDRQRLRGQATCGGTAADADLFPAVTFLVRDFVEFSEIHYPAIPSGVRSPLAASGCPRPRRHTPPPGRCRTPPGSGPSGATAGRPASSPRRGRVPAVRVSPARW